MTKVQAHVPDTSITLDDIPDLLTLAEAAAAVRLSDETLRTAIKNGRLPAFIPGYGSATTVKALSTKGAGAAHKPGRGHTYRIRRADLARWYFGTTEEIG